MRKAVILLSGGLDSATTLAVARDQGFAAYALTFSYGQRHEVELAAAARVAAALGAAEHRVFPVDLAAFGGSALTGTAPVPKGQAREGEVLRHDRRLPADQVERLRRVGEALRGRPDGGSHRRLRQHAGVQHPDFTRDQNGALCTGPGTFGQIEWGWAVSLLGQLNSAIAKAASSYGWHVVTAHVDAFRTHGYCSSDSWMDSLSDWALNPGGVGSSGPAPTGVFHPNLAGQEAYAAAVTPVLESVLKSDK